MSNSTPVASIIIPTFKRPAGLGACLTAVLNSAELLSDPKSIEVIVTDDDPQGSARDVVAKHGPAVFWNQGPSRGPAANRNSGARRARGELLIFLDDDCIPQKGWLPAMLQCATDHLGAEVFEGRIIAERKLQYAYECCPANEKGGYLWSANLGVKRKLIDSLNGFDEEYPFAAMEDVDFRYRCEKAGAEVVFCRDAAVSHPVEIRPGNVRFLKAQYSHILFIEKHPEQTQRIRGSLVNVLRVLKDRTVRRSLVQPLASYVSLAQELWSMLTVYFVLGSPARTQRRKQFLASKLSIAKSVSATSH